MDILRRSVSRHLPRFPGCLALSLMVGASSSGCVLVKNTLELPDKAVGKLLPQQGLAIDPVELSGQLMRFSDEHLAEVITASEGLRRNGNPLAPVELKILRLSYTDNVFSIVIGPNALSNLLDMAILVSLARMTVESRWVPGEYGASATPLLTAYQRGESRIWEIVKATLPPPQVIELRQAISQWHEKNPATETFRTVRALGFAATLAKNLPIHPPGEFPSVFNALKIDPLAGLDPATRELAQSRLFAERAMFIAQRMPNLIREEVELLTVQTAGLPEIRELLNTSKRLTDTAQQMGIVVEHLPGLVANERKAILSALAKEQQDLQRLVMETRGAFATGTQMVAATDEALRTFDDVMSHLRTPAPALSNRPSRVETSSPSTPAAGVSVAHPAATVGESEPFRIQNYTVAAERIDAAAARLTTLLEIFMRTSDPERFKQLFDHMGALEQQAGENTRAVVNYAFEKAVLLLVILCLLVTGSALFYRWAVFRLARSGQTF